MRGRSGSFFTTTPHGFCASRAEVRRDRRQREDPARDAPAFVIASEIGRSFGGH